LVGDVGGVFVGFSRFIVAIGLFFLFILAATNTVQGSPIATPNGQCYVTSYSSMEMYGLTTSIENNRIVIGDELFIESNCEGTIQVESKLFDTRTFNSGLIIIEMPTGYGNMTISGDNWNVTYQNVTFMSYGSYYQGIINEYKGNLPAQVDINEDELAFREITASLSTLVLAWIGSVMIVDRFARYWVDKFMIEEVI